MATNVQFAPGKEVFTIREAAAYLRIHPVTLYRKAEKGEIPGGKIGSTWRFHRSVLEKLVCGELPSCRAALSGENE